MPLSPLYEQASSSSFRTYRVRWADCQLTELRKCLRPSAVRRCLSTLPKTLDETYSRILEAIPEIQRQDAITALTWLVCAKQPLTIHELVEAIIINLEDEESPIGITDRIVDEEILLNILRGLASTSGGRVRLAHFSVQEYLTSDRLAGSPLSAFWVSPPDCEPKLLKACLRYMQTEAIIKRDFQPLLSHLKDRTFDWWLSRAGVVSSPLLMHAGLYWMECRSRSETPAAVSTIHAIVRFLQCQPAMSLWKCVAGGKIIEPPLQDEAMEEATLNPIFYACCFGFRMSFLLFSPKPQLQRGPEGETYSTVSDLHTFATTHRWEKLCLMPRRVF